MNQDHLIIGMMSGTSLDGIDTVLMQFSPDQQTLVATQHTPYPNTLRHQLEDLISNPASHLATIGTLDQTLGKTYANAALKLIKAQALEPKAITAIGNHGQTIYHQPKPPHAFTWQIGNPHIITAKTGITTVADFRSLNMTLGGQGAPLAPAFHQSMIQSNQCAAVINIGGIANVTLLNNKEVITGFDTGPGNALLDAWIQQHQNQAYDQDGRWAATGQIQNSLLETLQQEPYFSQPHPKSTGKELFHLNWLQTFLSPDHKPEDVQATLVELTALSISQSITSLSPQPGHAYVCGGGVHNHFLMQRLAHHLPHCSIETTSTLGIDPDWVEAALIAWLTYQRLQGIAIDLCQCTGVKQPHLVGDIFVSP